MTNKPYWVNYVLRLHKISQELFGLLSIEKRDEFLNGFQDQAEILGMYTSALNEMYSTLWKHDYDDINDLPKEWLSG